MTDLREAVERVSELLARTTAGGPNGTCLEWTGRRSPQGYGLVGVDRKTKRVHRLVAEAVGFSIEGLAVCHRCDNPPCINPEHLFVGTLADNNRDMRSKGRARYVTGTHRKEAKLTEAAVLDIRTKRLSQPAFARLYGVSQRLIGIAQRGQAWRHVGFVSSSEGDAP